jgi:hypothetical protein
MSSRNGVLHRTLTVGFKKETDEPIKQRIGFSFTMNFWNELCKLENISMSEIGSIFSDSNKRLFETYMNVLYCAALAYAEVRDIQFDFDRKMAGEWISEMEQDEFNELIEEMANTRIFGKNMKGLKVNKDQAA